ncbi:OmpH family outer membrane protein [Moheibacter stercoris]|uniref:Outer membrane protein n=1 Tax=Moheibacter stercoris TaxID=1628251 RepID=A0ABV2LSJ5_9FLAO
MKNLLLTLLFIGILAPLSAQRFGYVDTDFILENLPEYAQAQQRLKTQTEQWNTEIRNRQEALQKRQADFLNEKVLLTEEQAKKEEEDIHWEGRQIQILQENRYGQDGDLIKLRKTLVKPIQDQIWVAVKEVAEKRNYGFIFDKGSDLIMVYTDPKFDISREVLLKLNPNALKEGSSSSSNNNNATPSRNTNTSNQSRGASSNTSNKAQTTTPGKAAPTGNSIRK